MYTKKITKTLNTMKKNKILSVFLMILCISVCVIILTLKNSKNKTTKSTVVRTELRSSEIPGQLIKLAYMKNGDLVITNTETNVGMEIQYRK